MSVDPQIVQQLLDEVLDSERTPEDVCNEFPELLSEVKHRWQKIQRLQAEIDDIFPASSEANVTQRRPLQSVCLAAILARLIEESYEEMRTYGCGIDQIRARVRYIQERIRPGVVNRLVNDLQKEESQPRITSAARLLIRLNEGRVLDQVTSLTSLDLSGEPVGAFALKQIENNQNITELNVSGTYLGAGGLSQATLEFVKLMRLQSISLAGTNIRSSALEYLECLPTLKWLDLRNTQVNDAGAMSLQRITNLKYVNLKGSNVSNDIIDYLRSIMPEVEIVG